MCVGLTEKRYFIRKLSEDNPKYWYIADSARPLSDNQLFYEEIVDLLNKNEELKSEVIKVIDRKIKNNDSNPSQDFQIYSKVNQALKDVRESLRDVIEEF